MPGIVKYHDIKELIREEILTGKFPPGSQLPSEPKLAELYRASRGTIREALRELEQDAVIARRSGIGTIVLRRPKSALITSFTEQVRAAGMKPSTELLGARRVMASEARGRVIEAFLLDDEAAARTPVYEIDRLRCGDARPLAQQTIYLLVSDFGSDLLEEADLTGSLFTLYTRFRRHVSWADEIIAARPPTSQETKTLGMQDTKPSQRLVYERQRISYDSDNQPLEVLLSIDRSDFFHGYRFRIMEETPITQPLRRTDEAPQA